MWAGHRRDFVPQEGARACGSRGIRVIQDDILNTLRIEVNLAMITARQALEKLRERALRAMTAVYKRGNHGEPQSQRIQRWPARAAGASAANCAESASFGRRNKMPSKSQR